MGLKPCGYKVQFYSYWQGVTGVWRMRAHIFSKIRRDDNSLWETKAVKVKKSGRSSRGFTQRR